MSAHRRVRASRHAVRRTFTAAVVAVASGAGFLALAEPAHAAATWFVKPAALGGSTNGATCGTSAATACATVTLALGRAAASGDTISVAAGSYTDRPVITKSVTINGAGTNALTGTVLTNGTQAGTSVVTVANANLVVTITDLRVINGTGAGGIGGGLKIGNGSTNPVVNTTNVVLDGNKAVLGAGVAVFAGATWNASATTLSNNVASGTNSAGGGVYNNGTMNFANGTITGNTAPLGGGAVNTSTGGSITATSITQNTGSTQGGGVWNSGTLGLSGNTITQNSSPTGAGLYSGGGTTTIGAPATPGSGGALSSNTATGASGVGGGLYVNAGVVTVNNATVQQNTAPIGAGLYNFGGTLNTKDGVIGSNTATNAGAGIINVATLNVNGTTIQNNGAAAAGGGVYQYAGAATLSGATIKGNTAPQGAGVFVNNTAPGITITNSTVSNNTATTQGGGLTALQPSATTISGSTFDGNVGGGQGGAIVTAGPLTMTGTAITNNSATNTGGGLVTAGATTITGGSITGNSAANAGGYYTVAATTIDGTVLNNNTANGGSALNAGNAGAIYNAGALTIKNASMTGNKVVASTNSTAGNITGYGGAIFSATLNATQPSVTLSDTAINGGAVSGGNAFIGGAIAVYQNTVSGGTTSKITGTNLTLSKNVAAAAGGIFTSGALTLTGSTLDQNQATHASAGNGGAVYAGGSPIVLDNTDVTGNSAKVSGGGLFLVGNSSSEIRNGSSLTGNTAVSGGAIVNTSPLAIKDSHVDGNTASYAGAGLYNGGTTTVKDTTFNGNSAAAFGGGILTGTGALTVTGGEINDNDAFAGGGVIVAANSTASFDGTDFKDNTSTGASSGGGAILSAGALTVKNATMSGNKADGASGYGAAIYSGSTDDNVATTLTVDATTITDNEAFAAAAIVAGSNGTGSTNKTSISNSTITGNASASAVGALQLYQSTSITHSVITDNTAGGAANQNVGGLVAAAGVVGLSSSVISGNTGKQCFAAVSDGGYNLAAPGETTCGFTGAKNDVFAAHGLAPLADNGGRTQTRLPSSSAAVLDRIPAAAATGITDPVTGTSITLCGAGAVDQRGEARPAGAKCDIGSVEKAQVAPTVSGPATADASVGNAMAPLTYTSTGSPQPTLSATGLPSGVTLHDNGDGTATISGTPASGSGGDYAVTVKATNEAGSGTTALTLVVHQAPTIGGPATATYTVGQPGSSTFTQTTGHPLGIFTSTGLLPTGVTFDGSTAGQGTYSGTPAAGTGGVYNLTVKDDNGTPPAATAPFALTVNEATGLTGPGSATFTVGAAGTSAEFVATGFPVPTLSQTGLPAGLSLTGTGAGRARISGTAANGTGGVYPVTVTAQNGVGAPASTGVSVTVNEAPELTGPSVARFVAGSANSIGFSSDGYPQATLTRTGTLPAGLTFVDNGNGSATLSGTAPTSAIGTYTVTVRASNGVDPDATRTVTIQVVPPLSISSSTLPNAAYRTAYSAQIIAVGGQPAYSFTLQPGSSLPAGLSMNSAGLVTGSTTAAPGTYTFTVKATDTAIPAQTAIRTITLKVVKGDTDLRVAPILLTMTGGNLKLNIALFEADLKGGFPLQPIAGETVKFKSGSTVVCSAKTDANGHVKCQPDLVTAILVPLSGTITASYAGSTVWNPSTSSAGLIG